MPVKTPTGKELYVFPTITSGPTEVYLGVSGNPAEYGIEPGTPEPLSDNRTDERLGVVGTLREASRTLLPITVTVEGVAAYEQGLRSLVDRRQNQGDIRVNDIVRQIARGKRLQQANQVAVPRFGVQFETDTVVRGIDPEFRDDIGLNGTLTAPASHTLVNPATSTELQTFGGALVVDRRGRLYCFFVVREDASPNRHTVIGYRYDQSVDTAWQLVVTVGDLISQQTAGSNPTRYILSTELTAPGIAATVYRNDVYVFVSDAGVATDATKPAAFHVYRFRESDETLVYVAGPVAVGTGLGLVGDGGIAACALSDRMLVALGCLSANDYATGNPLFPGVTRTIWLGLSTDGVKWSDQTDNTSGFVALGDFTATLTKEAGETDEVSQTVNDFAFDAVDGASGFAVCQSGRIYYTEDGGRTWSKQDSPITTALYAVQILTGTGTSITAVAVGAAGAILLTRDSGVTWKIVSISSTEAANIAADRFIVATEGDAIYRSRPVVGDQPLYDCVFRATGEGWIVGENRILYCQTILSDKAAPISHGITPKETTGTYTSVILLDDAANTLLVGGIMQRQRTKSGSKDLGEYQFVKITNATMVDPTYPDSYTFQSKTTSGATGMRIEAMVRQDSTHVWACGRGGALLKTGDGGTTWTKVYAPTSESEGAPISHDLVDLVWRQGTSDATHELLVLTAEGLLLRSVSSGLQWVVQHVGTETIGQAVATPKTLPLAQIDEAERGIIVVGGGTNLWRADLTANFQAMPALLAIGGAEALLATADLVQGRVDLRRTLDRGQTWATINIDGVAQRTFVAQAATTTDIVTALRPSLCLTDAGEVVLTAGDDSIVSVDGRGEDWIAGRDATLPVPVGLCTPDLADEDTFYVSRQTIAFGHGRLLSIFQVAPTNPNNTNTIRSRSAREWTTSSILFMPVLPGKSQWIGVDDLRVIFDAADLPVGEGWQIPPRFRFPGSNLMLDFRSQFWRGADEVNELADIVMLWDAGTGQQWQFTAGGLIGSNVRIARIALSVPTYLAATAPTSPTDWTEFTLFADVDQGRITAVPGTNLGHNVLAANGKTWLPGQFRPNFRQYYVAVTPAATGTTSVYPILDNAKDQLLVTRASGAPAIALNDPFIIFTDRMYCTGEGGSRGTSSTSPPLIHTPYAFGRWLRLTIPSQATAEGYRKADTFVAGVHVPLTYETAEGEFDRDGIALGWRVRAMANSVEEAGLEAGVVATTSFGGSIREWDLGFGARYEEDVRATFSPMIARMRRNFLICFDAESPTDSVELVRLVNDNLELTQSGGRLFSTAITLREVR